MFYFTDLLTFVQIPNEEVNQIIKKEKAKHYTTKELIEHAADKLADIYVRFMDKKNTK